MKEIYGVTCLLSYKEGASRINTAAKELFILLSHLMFSKERNAWLKLTAANKIGVEYYNSVSQR